jgi:hypothetical protein
MTAPRPNKITETDIAELAATVKAPESLHRRIEEMVAADRGSMGSPIGQQRRAPTRRRPGWTVPAWGKLPGRWTMPAWRRAPGLAAAAIAVALAAVAAVALAIGLSGGGTPRLSARQVADLALSPATLPAPAESSSERGELAASVGSVAFPYWEERFGWRSSGARADTLGGRPLTTVFYTNAGGQRIGYAIVAGPAPAAAASGGALVRRRGVPYRLSSQDGANVIVWRRRGQLCVIAGRGVSPSTLLALASWGSDRGHTAHAA